MKNIKIGIVGAGNRAAGLGRNLIASNGVEISALCDPDPERLANLAEDFRISKSLNT